MDLFFFALRRLISIHPLPTFRVLFLFCGSFSRWPKEAVFFFRFSGTPPLACSRGGQIHLVSCVPPFLFGFAALFLPKGSLQTSSDRFFFASGPPRNVGSAVSFPYLAFPFPLGPLITLFCPYFLISCGGNLGLFSGPFTGLACFAPLGILLPVSGVTNFVFLCFKAPTHTPFPWP